MLVKSPLPLSGVSLGGGLIAVLTAGGMDGGRGCKKREQPGSAIDKKSSTQARRCVQCVRCVRAPCDATPGCAPANGGCAAGTQMTSAGSV